MFDKMLRRSMPGPGTFRPPHRPAKRAAAAALSVCMVLTLMPSAAFAVEAKTGLCEHHPEHTADCGYREATPGHPCEHEHTAECCTDELLCGYIEDEDWTASGSDADHVHTLDCYVPDCPHERGEHRGNGREAGREGGLGHDGSCGYIEAVEGRPCGYVCALCGEPDKDSGAEGAPGGDSLPVTEEPKPETVQPEGVESITITAFDALDETVQYQSVPAGTKLDDLTLPDTLGATGYTVAPDTEPTPEPVMVDGVTWEPDSPWDEAAEQGSYLFTPVLPEGYALGDGVELPELYVMVGVRPILTANSDDADNDGYHDGDVAVVNGIIDDNGLSATKDDPAGWATGGALAIVTWNDESPKRIIQLRLDSKRLTGALDVSSLTSLTNLSCKFNQLTELTGLGSLTSLTNLNCESNQLTELTGLGSLTSLTDLNCKSNRLTELTGLGSLTSLTNLNCESNQLTELTGLGSLTSLTDLICKSNQLTELTGLGSLTSLTNLNCESNQLTGLGSLTSLTDLICGSNELTELTGLDSLTSLNNLTCEANELTELTGLESLTSLEYLNCMSNQLTELDVSGLTLLRALYCNSNQLTELDVSGLTLLRSLYCESNQLTELTGLESLTSLEYLHCISNQLTELDVSGLTSLNMMTCGLNPLASLKLSNTARLTVRNAAGGTVMLTDYSFRSKDVTLKATAANGYTFKKWTATAGTAAILNTFNPAIFTLDCRLTITPVFEDQAVADAQAVVAAKSAIEGGGYTVAQANAGTEDALKTALAQQINALSGMSATGISVTANNITFSSFNAATAGDADDMDGTNGSFSFTVALSKGTASDTTGSIDGIITATAYTGQSNAQAVAAAKSAIEGGTYTIAQPDAGTQDALKTVLAQQLNALSGMNSTGITVGTEHITISSFTPAAAGNPDDPDGTNGVFTFTVTLSNGTVSDTTAVKDGTITATAYTGYPNAQAVAAAKSTIEGGTYTVAQADAGDETALKTALVQQINTLDGMSGTGITVAADNITIRSFTAATAGDANGADGINGSFSFTVALYKGAASDITARKDGTITATHYISSDATLSSLSLTGAVISPAFDPATTTYSASVDYGVSSITINATAADSGAILSGDIGVKSLAVGVNTFTVTVTAADGSKLTYTITITRADYSGGGSSSGGGGSSSSSGSSSSAPSTTTSTTAGENGTSTTTTQTTSKDSSGKTTTVTTEVTKDAAGNATGGATTVTTDNITASENQGNAAVTVKPDAAAINSAAKAAGASETNPMDILMVIPQDAVKNEIQKADVSTVDVEVVLPKPVGDNPAVRTVGVTVEKETVDAARQTGKTVTVTVREETGTVKAVWSLDGQAMGNAAGQSTDLKLGVYTAPVQSGDPIAAPVKPPVTEEGKENGLVISLTVEGTLLSAAKLTVPATNQTAITAGSTVALYRFDQSTGALSAVSGGIYPVDANGNVTLDIPAGARTGAKETYVLLPV